MEKIIFVVDDNEINLVKAKEALQDQYRVLTMTSALRMFELLEKRMPDLILLDIEMPDMSGFEALNILKSKSYLENIPVIFLTSTTDTEIEVKGFQLGVIDFITKPFSAPVLLNRLKTHIHIDEIIRERTALLQQKTNQLQTLQTAIVSVLADMVERRDATTGGHIERTSIYLKTLITEMEARGVYADIIRGYDMDLLISSARLHDVGKINITDVILNKPGKLTEEEFEIIKTHCTVGEYIIDQIASHAEDVSFLQYAKLIVSSHHERWDGTGYPKELAGEDIPLLGRIMAVVDVYDALLSERPYKKAFDHDEAVKIIMEGSGTHFDPKIADVFFQIKDKLRII